MCGLAFYEHIGNRLITGLGAAGGISAAIALVVRLVEVDPASLGFLVTIILVAVFGRPYILRFARSNERD